MYRARYYRREKDKIRCLLCPTFCLLEEGRVGACGVRRVEGGELYEANYGRLAAVQLDPVEKKPLYHYYPGRQILSLGTCGCNLHCSFCQNWTLARGEPELAEQVVSPADILAMLERQGGPGKAFAVAYTYNEPLVWYEFVFNTARLLHEHGYRNVLVTNGYINPEPLHELLPYIDAMNIDLKAFRDSFYRKYCRGKLEPVLETIKAAAGRCHVEITCLLIPGLNDSSDEQAKLARWLAALSPDLVLHYSRYFPQYKLDRPPTPQKDLERVRTVARQHLRYVYLGNIDLPGSADTVCPHCGNLLIIRSGYRVRLAGLEGQVCSNCRRRIDIILPDSL